MGMDHRSWVVQATGDSLRGVARRCGINEGNFPGQAKNGLSADRVIAIARAYGLDVVAALVETGHVSAREVPQVAYERIGRAVVDLARAVGQVECGHEQ